jgi:hypothetical protein
MRYTAVMADTPIFHVSLLVTGTIAEENEDEVVRSLRAALKKAGLVIKRLEVEEIMPVGVMSEVTDE